MNIIYDLQILNVRKRYIFILYKVYTQLNIFLLYISDI